jgi:hypothetical protein
MQEDIIDAKEPLILSLLVTVYDELKNFHTHLKILSQFSEEQGGAPQSQQLRKAQDFFRDTLSFKGKL